MVGKALVPSICDGNIRRVRISFISGTLPRMDDGRATFRLLGAMAHANGGNDVHIAQDGAE